MALTSTFKGDMKPAPGPKDGANEMKGPDYSVGSLGTPHTQGVFQVNKNPEQILGVTTQVDLPHGSPKLSSPFQGDMRPGVNSAKE